MAGEQCYQCEHWKYNERIEKQYGEGTGLCNGEPKGCNRAACMRFKKRIAWSGKGVSRNGRTE